MFILSCESVYHRKKVHVYLASTGNGTDVNFRSFKVWLLSTYKISFSQYISDLFWKKILKYLVWELLKPSWKFSSANSNKFCYNIVVNQIFGEWRQLFLCLQDTGTALSSNAWLSYSRKWVIYVCVYIYMYLYIILHTCKILFGEGD